MIDLLEMVAGPFVRLEAARETRRGGLFILRGIAAVVVFLSALRTETALLWDDVLFQTSVYHEYYVSQALMIAISVTIALAFTPSIAAGSLSGDSERGALGLLLTSRATSWEIVAGRFLGKLAQTSFVLLVFFPAFVWFGSHVDAPLWLSAACLAPGFAVAIGATGLAVACSSITRRARDSLILTYLVMIALILTPFASIVSPSIAIPEWVDGINPYSACEELARGRIGGATFATIVVWPLLGFLGVALATWRVRPACMKTYAGDRRSLRRRRGVVPVPPVDERRPMLWKEVWIEKVVTFGIVGRILAALMILPLVGIATAAIFFSAWYRFHPDSFSQSWRDSIWLSIDGFSLVTTTLFAWLIEWGVGLRAAASIASERERGAWDALLASPLTAGEIVFAKTIGSLLGMKHLILAGLYFWTAAWIGGSLSLEDYLTTITEILFLSAFMAAIGLQISLRSKSAARAMSTTIIIWLTARLIVYIASLFAVVYLTFAFAYWINPYMILTAGRLSLFRAIPIIQHIVGMILYAITAILAISVAAFRFDRLAGRFVEGDFATALDHLLEGTPQPPVAHPFEVESESKADPKHELKDEPIATVAP